MIPLAVDGHTVNVTDLESKYISMPPALLKRVKNERTLAKIAVVIAIIAAVGLIIAGSILMAPIAAVVALGTVGFTIGISMAATAGLLGFSATLWSNLAGTFDSKIDKAIKKAEAFQKTHTFTCTDYYPKEKRALSATKKEPTKTDLQTLNACGCIIEMPAKY